MTMSVADPCLGTSLYLAQVPRIYCSFSHLLSAQNLPHSSRSTINPRILNMAIPWTQAVRIVQIIFGLIVLALAAYGASPFHPRC
jgi:hypothetical protein